MLGLFGTLQLGQRSLQTQRQGVEVTGHNLANVNNPDYARQRVEIQSNSPLVGATGQYGTGASVVEISQVRSSLVDQQIQRETSLSSYLEAQQNALLFAQADLGQQIDRQSTGADGTSNLSGVGNQHGIAEGLTDLFNSFQSLSTQPTSLTERQGVIIKAQNLAAKFNQTDQRLTALTSELNQSIRSDVDSANQLLADIARLNDEISRSELNSASPANDLRDARQKKLEDLSKIVRIDGVNSADRAMEISVNGVPLVTGNSVANKLEAYDPGSGNLLLRAQNGTPLTPAGGKIQGMIEARDGAIHNLKAELNLLATTLISEVNQIHRAGYGLSGSTGADFFTGDGAGNIQVNAALRNNASLLQASGSADATGDNKVILQLAQLADKKISGLNNQTISQNYSKIVAGLGEALSSVNAQMDDQRLVQQMLDRQRQSISGVSIDEEMTNLMKFQKGYEASAKLITTIDEMLDTVLSLKR